jgi:hypothetical protein
LALVPPINLTIFPGTTSEGNPARSYNNNYYFSSTQQHFQICKGVDDMIMMNHLG